MGIDPVTATIGSAVLGAVMGQMQGSKAEKASKRASQQASADAKKSADMAEQDMNRRNAKQPDVRGLQAGNELAAQEGETGTMLTGPSGVDPSTLALGKNTLLGV